MFLALALSKSASFLIKKTLKRSGSTWPGHIALRINPKLVNVLLSKNPDLKIILIAGTNGKTTTTKLLSEILTAQKKKVFTNNAGANLLNGIASSLIHHTNIQGKIDYNAAVFEIDENALPQVLKSINPDSIVILNLFRDQLDRYGEVNTIAQKWQDALGQLPHSTKLFINGDDPKLRFIGENSGLHSYYFGLDEKFMKKTMESHDSDFSHCPHCNTRLIYKKRAYSHMGLFYCPKCKFQHQTTQTFSNLPNPLLGDYNRYNINAGALTAQKSFGISEQSVGKTLLTFLPAFGRQEKIQYRGKDIFLLLSKNPTGFNRSIDAVLSKDTNPSLLFILNDRIPDGRDISWIWDVDFENITHPQSIMVTGDRAHDMTLRMHYAGFDSSICMTEEHLEKAINSQIQKIPQNKTLYILATYSGMLETRKILLGKKLL